MEKVMHKHAFNFFNDNNVITSLQSGFCFVPADSTANQLVPLIPKPHFWICIFLFQTELFHLKFMISAMTLILI